jgi:hypothetical protein
MRKRLLSISAVVLAVVSITVGTMTMLQPVVAAGSTCLDKHCSSNTHCCFGCTGKPICVRNGVPCPECAPQ